MACCFAQLCMAKRSDISLMFGSLPYALGPCLLLMHQGYRLYAASRQRAIDRELELPGRSLKHLTASPCQL